jgi:hypothetical protein
MTTSPVATEVEVATLTPAQAQVFDHLLAYGARRPTMPANLVGDLTKFISARTTTSVDRWTESRLWLSKSKIETALRCEGQLVADASQERSPLLPPATAVGIVTHKAIQLAHTHPKRPIATYVDAAIRASLQEPGFNQFWNGTDMAIQSDLMGAMISRTTAFLDSFPPLAEAWTPRFEEQIQAQIGKLTLAAKPDFTLGRPKADLSQTMFLADLKTGPINENHAAEAMYYALVATLRFGVAPFRSVVFSLSSGEWTEPDVTPEKLYASAERVCSAVASITDVMTDQRPALLNPGRWCNWCPASASCAESTTRVPVQITEAPTEAPPAPDPF